MSAMAMSEFQHITTSFSYWDFFTVYTTGPVDDCCPGKVNVLVETIGYFVYFQFCWSGDQQAKFNVERMMHRKPG